MLTAFTFKSAAQNTNCNAGFDFSITNFSVKFNFSVSGDSAQTHSYWRFGDGNVSPDFSPTHVYVNAGAYTVTHIVYKTQTGVPNATCIDSVTKHVQLTAPVLTCNLHALFSYKRDSSQKNKIYFTNLSTPAADIHYTKWSFGDGTYSYDLNATHVYTTSGLYTVCVTVEKEANSTNCQRDTCMQIQVQAAPVCNLVAGFTWKIDSANHNKLFFTNTSTPAGAVPAIQWNFGDGTKSSSQNPDHIYAQPGIYNVCIRISSGTLCYKELCKAVEVKGNEINCNDISKFNITRSTANCLEFKFVPVNLNTNWQYHWSFGDGSGSNDISPSHVYQHSGNYTVYLTVYRSASCVSTSYKVAETGTCFSCSNIWVKYEYNHSVSSTGKTSFHATSNAKILSQTWTITNLSLTGSAPVILNQNNPEYLFTSPGEYLVCLKATAEGGCTKEYCEVVHITTPTTCTLSSYPNPAHTQISVNVQLTESQMIHAYIYNSLNVLVKQIDQQGTTGNNTVNLNIESLHAEWYTIRIVYGNKVCYSRFQKI